MTTEAHKVLLPGLLRAEQMNISHFATRTVILIGAGESCKTYIAAENSALG